MSGDRSKLIKEIVSNIEKCTAKTVKFKDGTTVAKDKLYTIIEPKDLVDNGFSHIISENRVEEFCKEIAQEAIKEKSPKKLVQNSIPKNYIDLNSYILCKDLITADRFLFSIEDRKRSQINPEIFMDRAKVENFTVDPIPVKEEYNPFVDEVVYNCKIDTHTYTAVNSYNPPQWLREGDSITDPKCPSDMWAFLNHLFPDEQSLKFVLGWMNIALTDRCETYLVLNGSKGVGKGIFTNSILKNLVGVSNYKEAPKSLSTSNFNSVLERCRILVMDEFSHDTTDKINALKRYANGEQNIEKKGKDADNLIKVYFSGVLTNNSFMDIKLEQDDRRFSVPIITDKPLKDLWGEEGTEKFLSNLEDPEYMKQFGYWVKLKCAQSGQDKNSCLKTSLFYDICYENLPEYAKIIIEKLTEDDRKSVSYVSLNTKFKELNYLPKKQTVKRFLNTYLHKGLFKLGSIEQSLDKSFELIKSKELIEYLEKSEEKVKIDNDDVNWGSL